LNKHAISVSEKKPVRVIWRDVDNMLSSGLTMDWSRTAFWRLRGAIAFALRLSVAALLALWIADHLGVKLPLWSVLTALIVTQVSLGRSLKATFDYFAGTIGGVLWGGIIAALVPHSAESGLLFVLMLALAPLALVAALFPRFSAAPVTAAIVVLIPQIIHATPVASAIERAIEVLLGGLTGLFVSFVLLPWSAFEHIREIAAEALANMAEAFPQLMEGFDKGLSGEKAHQIQDLIGQQLSELSSISAEAERERPLRLSGDPLTGPLFRALLRLRHDLVMLGRAAQSPLPASLKAALQEPLSAVKEGLTSHLKASAGALLSRNGAPSRESLDAALEGFAAEVDALKRSGSLRELPVEALELFFTSAFALEQMRRDSLDLDRCINEWQTRRR
jgi:uncharacterized membrane protein YccC